MQLFFMLNSAGAPGLKGGKINRGLVWMVATMVGLSGCAGAVLESQNHDG
jgi:hypothetical protein